MSRDATDTWLGRAIREAAAEAGRDARKRAAEAKRIEQEATTADHWLTGEWEAGWLYARCTCGWNRPCRGWVDARRSHADDVEGDE